MYNLKQYLSERLDVFDSLFEEPNEDDLDLETLLTYCADSTKWRRDVIVSWFNSSIKSSTFGAGSWNENGLGKCTISKK